MSGHNIIVIGASAGGVEALKELVAGFPADLPAAVFVVLHTSPQGPGYLPEILSRSGPLRAKFPIDHEVIEKGVIYVAPPDRHLVIADGLVRSLRGPKESRHRPAADALFRSAAEKHGARVVGVVLTGGLDDGTAGLQAIKEKGGIAVVQDPGDAFAPGMPSSAMSYVKVDHCLPLRDIAPMLVQLARDPVTTSEQPEDRELNMKTMKEVGEPQAASGLTCPECRASLWESRHGELPEFCCRVGHRFSPDGLLADQSEVIERTLWSLLNVIEERAALIDKLSAQAHKHDRNSLAAQLEAKHLAASRHADQVRQMLLDDGDWYSAADL